MKEALVRSAGAYPRLAVLAGYSPEGGMGGGVILRSILQEYPAEQLLWCVVLPNFIGVREWWRPEVHRKACAFGIRGKRFPLVGWCWKVIGHKVEAQIQARAASRAVMEFGADVVWAILDYNSLFAVDYFMRNTRLPVHVSVHDDPVITAQLHGFSVPTQAIARVFGDCYTRARSRDCISGRLCAFYRQKFNLESFVLTRGVDSRKVESYWQSKRMLPGNPIRILMAGPAACPTPWPADLIAALHSLRRGEHVTVEFHAFDQSLETLDKDVHVHGWLPEPEFDSLLETMDIGYACDPLTGTGRQFAATSVPTKVVTYIGAGLPFLYHGPLDSTVGDLVKMCKVGFIVESHEPELLAEGFRHIIRNYSAMRDACFRAAREHFNLAHLRSRLFDTLSADVALNRACGTPPVCPALNHGRLP